MRFALIFILFITPLAKAQQFHFENYSIEQGLSRSGVRCILQDKSSFLWIGTEGGGASKFDGVNFKNYSKRQGLVSENVRTIFQDKIEGLWFGTTDGLSYFDGNVFSNLTTEDGLCNNEITCITQDEKGNIWVGTAEGISIVDPKTKKISDEFKVDPAFNRLKINSLITQDDVVWIASDEGLYSYRNHELNLLTENDGLNHHLILSLFLSSKSELWVGTQRGVNKIVSNKISSLGLANGLLDERARTITEDAYGNIWVGTIGGVSIYDGNKFQSITAESGLINDKISCLTNDHFGNIWIGTYYAGIMKFNHNSFISYTENDGLLSNNVLCINEDEKGDIIVGSYNGASKLRIRNGELLGITSVLDKNGIEGKFLSTVYKDGNNNYWYGTRSGVSIIGPNGVTYLNDQNGLKNSSITVIKNFQNQIWIGTQHGLAILDEPIDYAAIQLKFLDDTSGLAGQEVSSIIEDQRGRVWISFKDGQISVFENGEFMNPKLPESINEILTLAIDSAGQVWIGTHGEGVFYGKYNEQHQDIHLKSLSTNDKLLSNNVYSLLILDKLIWVGHENGLDLLSWDKDSNLVVKAFGTDFGFNGLQNNQNATYKDADGNLWFGTVGGLFFLPKGELAHFSEGSNSVKYITDVKIWNEEINWSNSPWCKGLDSNFRLPVDLVLPYDQNNISFDFLAINLVAPNHIKYRWKLEGFDKDWCPPTHLKHVSYTNLRPGKYSFILQSSDEHGIMQDTSISFDFVVEKPFWLTVWFIICAVIVGSFILWLIVRFRTRKLIKQKTELENVIVDRTREIQQQADELAIKNKEVTDSILYSRRIQGSLLPGLDRLDSLFENYFVLYKPKDIVSGDFYWVETNVKNPEQLFFAAADCTGHGVPGAMVSLIGVRALTACVRENLLNNTNEILDNTNKIVVEAFTDGTSGEIIKDGMDISLCSLDYSDKTNIKFQFSGAQNPAWIIRKHKDQNIVVNDLEIKPDMQLNDSKLFEIKGTKQPIGHFEGSRPFDLHKATLNKGDIIYLFTDGYADQFGGDKGKKFKYKTLKTLILNSQGKSLSEQREIFKQAFYDWKRDIEQVDDVCLLAIEV